MCLTLLKEPTANLSNGSDMFPLFAEPFDLTFLELSVVILGVLLLSPLGGRIVSPKDLVKESNPEGSWHHRMIED